MFSYEYSKIILSSFVIEHLQWLLFHLSKRFITCQHSFYSVILTNINIWHETKYSSVFYKIGFTSRGSFIQYVLNTSEKFTLRTPWYRCIFYSSAKVYFESSKLLSDVKIILLHLMRSHLLLSIVNLLNQHQLNAKKHLLQISPS